MTGIDVTWLLTAWAIVGSGIVLWFGEALTALEGPRGRRTGPRTCACCRHDVAAHPHTRHGNSCAHCPCEGFRRVR